MSNICAGIGLGQMKILDDYVVKRRRNHEFYRDLFRDIEDVELYEVLDENYFSICWLNTILIKSNSQKNLGRESLRLAFEDQNIETRPLWKPMHLQPIFEEYPFYGNKVAEDLFEKGLCLPSGSNLTFEEKKRIKEVLVNFFK
jgi:dTDP-4-amino-4,6-dideoxygalactose transaminase